MNLTHMLKELKKNTKTPKVITLTLRKKFLNIKIPYANNKNF